MHGVAKEKEEESSSIMIIMMMMMMKQMSSYEDPMKNHMHTFYPVKKTTSLKKPA